MSNLVLKKSTFIHIPKCGGTFLNNVVNKLELVYTMYRQPQNGHLYLHQMGNIEDKYNFTFVRHPYTWWPSFWNWSKRDRFSFMERKCPDFDTWIVDYGPFWMGQYTRMIQRYTGEDSLYPCKAKIHYIGKSENLKNDLLTALLNAKENIKENVYFDIYAAVEADQNLCNRQEYNKQISNTSKNIIYNAEKYVFDRFNYEP